jgi:hypothetical protein
MKMETLESIKQLVAELEVDTNKFFQKGNNSAGTRARKTSQSIKAALQQLREEIINYRKAQA